MQVDVKVPVLAESVAEATLMNWHKKAGESVSRGDSLIDIETDKVTLEVAALNDGVLTEILKGDGELVESNEVIARIDTAAKTGAVEQDKDEPQQQSLPVDEPQDEPKLSPAVRHLLDEHGLEANQIPLTENSDRLTKENVLNHLGADSAGKPENTAETSSPAPAPAHEEEKPSAPPVADIASGERPEERVPMTRLRKRAAERLLSAQHENALLTTFNEVNMQPVMDLRERYKDEFEKTHGVKLGFMSFFTKAAVEALKKFPLVNASVDGTDIVYHGYFDIGIAVSAPRGLVVPVLREADQLSFADVEANIRALGVKARDSKLTMEDLTGGTFTITNGGIFGSMLSTPIINPPQSAILGMHKIQDRPVAENGEVVVRPVMYLALSYDHRIIDGRETVQFLVSIKEQIEDPARLLLQL
ncbi:MAG: 2-oxoglutarate dehydrogenase complex dihydrolipoyllysine-residue succinyltransferase [Gammaproteobacteria bacterium]|nr:2-oxoglutarate dehydrogenase complex dihydrolipoyllysine-residue succinyltransferase [Gammaproteobacteria bacterium]